MITSNTSLKGLTYNISIYEQSNETRCVLLKSRVRDTCSPYFLYGLLPNLVGMQNMLTVLTKWEQFKTYIFLFERLCYQHSAELGCYVMVPKCDPVSRQVTHPCREMCYDFVTPCAKITLPHSLVSALFPHLSSKKTVVWDTSPDYDCGYLPSLNGDIPCLYKPVICKLPPLVKNATLLSRKLAKNITYSAFDRIQYSCNEGFMMQGNKSVTCMYNGQWSAPPTCVLKPITKSRFLTIGLPLLLMVLTILFIIAVCKCRKKKLASERLIRNKQFDAFVCYCYEEQDQDFAENIISKELEEEYGFSLCIHRRDFKAGWDIKWNIMNAIRNSNSAIIIMSQDYINSLWCVEEFEDCYMENLKDPAFKLFVILMQPTEMLDVTNEYIKSFFAKKTYLEKEDPKLFNPSCASRRFQSIPVQRPGTAVSIWTSEHSGKPRLSSLSSKPEEN